MVVRRLQERARQHEWDLVTGPTELPLRDDEALVGGMAEPGSRAEQRVRPPHRSGRWRLLTGMVLADRPWLLVPGLTLLVATIASIALYVVNVVWALFILDPDVMGSSLHSSLGYHDLFVLSWFVASARPSAAPSAPASSRTRPSAQPPTRSARRSVATCSCAGIVC